MSRIRAVVIIGAIVAVVITGCAERDSGKEAVWECLKASKGGEDMEQISWWSRAHCEEIMERAKEADIRMSR